MADSDWFTAEENNVPFVIETGYFPVRRDAYRDFLQKNDARLQSGKYHELYGAVQKIHAGYEFFVPPFFDGYGETEKKFSDAQTELFKKYRGKADSVASISDDFLSKLLSELESAVE